MSPQREQYVNYLKSKTWEKKRAQVIFAMAANAKQGAMVKSAVVGTG
jgi:hypothetical protein